MENSLISPTTERVRNEDKNYIPTLIGYYQQKKPQATKLLSVLAKAKITPLSVEDQNLALKDIQVLDPDFIKTFTLSYKTWEFRKGSLVPVIFPWIGKIISQFLVSQYHWNPNEGFSTLEDYYSLVSRLLTSFSNKKELTLAMHVLGTTTIHWSWSRKLSVSDSLSVIRRVIQESKIKDLEKFKTDREGILFFMRSPFKFDGLIKWTAFLDRWVEMAEFAEKQARRIRLNCAEMEQRNQDLTKECENLHSEVERQRKAINEIHQQFQESQVVAAHSLEEHKSRTAAFLGRKLRYELDTSKQALTLDPPRILPALERIEAALEYIQEEMQCLRLSD